MTEAPLTEEEIEEGIATGKWHWAGGTGGCGNQYLVSGRDPGPYILFIFILFTAFIMGFMFISN